MLTFCCICMRSFFFYEKWKINVLHTVDGLPRCPFLSLLFQDSNRCLPGLHSLGSVHRPVTGPLRFQVGSSAAWLPLSHLAVSLIPSHPATLNFSVPAESHRTCMHSTYTTRNRIRFLLWGRWVVPVRRCSLSYVSFRWRKPRQSQGTWRNLPRWTK